MTENHYGNKHEWQGAEGPDKVEAELGRLWDAEIKNYFRAEGEFLREHGRRVGYGEDYITQVLSDHRRLEDLVRLGGAENIRRFSILLAGHFRYKEEYLAKHMDHIVDPRRDPGLDEGNVTRGN